MANHEAEVSFPSIFKLYLSSALPDSTAWAVSISLMKAASQKAINLPGTDKSLAEQLGDPDFSQG